MNASLHVGVFLDGAQRWRWQLRGSDERPLAEACESFATYSLALRDAAAVCRCIADAPIEVEIRPTASEGIVSPRIRAAFAEACQALDGDRLEAALAILNRAIPHRYSAIYWMPDAEQLQKLAVFDKLGEPYPDSLQSVPYNESFCQFAIREGQFRTANSALDARLDGNVYQGVLNSYHAVPLLSSTGQVMGTLCHFDTAALSLEDEDFELLRMIGPVVAAHLPQSAPQFLQENGPPMETRPPEAKKR